MLPVVLSFLLLELQRIEHQGAETREFFLICKDVINALLAEGFLDSTDAVPHPVEQIFQIAVTRLKAHTSREAGHSMVRDNTLHGLLGVIAASMSGSKSLPALRSAILRLIGDEDLVAELFYRCLFY